MFHLEQVENFEYILWNDKTYKGSILFDGMGFIYFDITGDKLYANDPNQIIDLLRRTDEYSGGFYD